MFERYTERARRVIFFARYEASQVGSSTIEPEHLLLGLLREDQHVLQRFAADAAAVGMIRLEIENRSTVREKTSTAIDLPLSDESKRILAYATEEASRLGHLHIGTEHLLLGMLCEENCAAAEILRNHGMIFEPVREKIADGGAASPGPSAPPPPTAELLQILEYAREEADLMKQRESGVHLLLGILKEGGGEAARVLNKLGVSLDRIRKELGPGGKKGS